jgi:hypothetical protein
VKGLISDTALVHVTHPLVFIYLFIYLFIFKSIYCLASNAETFYLQTCAMNHTVRQREGTSIMRRSVEGVKEIKGVLLWNRSGGEGHLRRVPRLVRPRREWAEEGVGGFEELAEAASPVSIRKGCRHGEVAAYDEEHSRDGVMAASMEDVP